MEAPRARAVSPVEGQEMRLNLSPLVVQDQRAQGIVGRADKPGTMVFEYASGQEFKELMAATEKHTEPALMGRELRRKSPLRLFADKDFVTAMGYLSAIDIFLGNRDRLLMFNPENFKVDLTKQTVLLIDNVQMNDEFAFTTFTNDVRTLTSAQALDLWRRHDSAQRLRDADWAGLARDMFESIELVIMRGVRNEDRALVGQILKGKQAHIWLADGLKKGKAWLNTIVSQDRLPELMKGIPADLREDVQTSLKRRLMFIAT